MIRLFDLAWPRLEAAGLPPANARELRAMLRDYDSSVSRLLCLEVPFKGFGSSVRPDLLIRLDPGRLCHLERFPHWHRLQAARLACEKHPGCWKQHGNWLEFDSSRDDFQDLEPILFIDLEGRVGDSAGGWPAAQDWLCTKLLPDTWGLALGNAAGSVARRCLENPPGQVARATVAILGCRQPALARLCLFDFPPRAESFSTYLTDIGWPGDQDRLLDLVGRYGESGAGLCLHLDLADQVLPRIGIDLAFLDSREPLGLGPGWRLLLGRLIEDGLCPPSALPALEAWPGTAVYTSPLLNRLLRMPSGPDSIEDGTLATWLTHIKLVLDADGNPEAKTYLYVGYVSPQADLEGYRLCPTDPVRDGPSPGVGHDATAFVG